MKYSRPRVLLALFFTVIFFVACAPSAQSEINRTDFVLGTVCSIRLIDGGTSKTIDEVFTRLRQIEDRMSANKDGTEIASVNANAGIKPVAVSPDTFFVISKALEYAKMANGAFDPTVGPLVKLWGIGSDSEQLPPQKDIATALKLIDYRKVEINPSAQTVFLPIKGMRLDLGAIAKGYAADEVDRILAKHKVKAAVIDLGGNVMVFGKKKDGSLWRVGIQNPDSSRGEYIGLVTGPEMTVVTSGIYERFFIQDGKRYHHILSTSNGYPVDNGLVSVSIITHSSIDADALSTSVFALGLGKGMELIKSLKDVYAVFIDTNSRVYLSPGANKLFSLTSKEFTLSE